MSEARQLPYLSYPMKGIALVHWLTIGFDVCIQAPIRRLDLTYWLFFTPLVTGLLTRVSTLCAIGLLTMTAAHATLPFGFWWQLPLALMLADS